MTTGAGSPEKYMKRWKAGGIKVIPVIASVAMAKRMERVGADAVVAEGTEAGGISERIRRWFLSRDRGCSDDPGDRCRRYCRRTYYGGGIVLGAEGVQMGTAFIATKEAAVHERYKACIVRAKDIDSRVTGRSTGHPGADASQSDDQRISADWKKTELRLKSWNA